MYHRKLNDVSLNKLSRIICVTSSCLKSIEKGTFYPGRELSKKLAAYFNLNTNFFYDPYLEDTENIHIKLKNYRTQNKLKIKDAAQKINVPESNWSYWENDINIPSRQNYYKLKKYKIL